MGSSSKNATTSTQTTSSTQLTDQTRLETNAPGTWAVKAADVNSPVSIVNGLDSAGVASVLASLGQGFQQIQTAQAKTIETIANGQTAALESVTGLAKAGVGNQSSGERVVSSLTIPLIALGGAILVASMLKK